MEAKVKELEKRTERLNTYSCLLRTLLYKLAVLLDIFIELPALPALTAVRKTVRFKSWKLLSSLVL